MARKNVIQFSVEVIDKASKKLAAVQTKMQRFAAALRKHGKTIALGFAAAGAAVFAFVNKITKAFDVFAKLSDLTGASVETLSQLEFAAKRSGIALQTLQVGIRGMTRNISDAATGIGEAIDALNELNVSATDLNKLEFEDQLLVLADAFGTVESGTRRLVLAQDIFGGRAAEILKLFKGGAPAIQAYAAQLDNLGGTVTTSAAESSARFQDSLTNLGAAFQGLKVALVDSGIVDALTDFTNGLARLIALSNDATIGSLNAHMTGLNATLVEMRRNFSGTTDEFFLLPSVMIFNEQIEETKQKLIELQKTNAGLAGREVPIVGGGEGSAAENAINKSLEGFVRSFDTTTQQVHAKIEMLRKAIAEGLIPSKAEQARIQAAILSALDAERIELTFDEIEAASTESFDFMAAAAEQAAQSMQSSLADFFFDPVENGLQGLLKSFIQVIRRMISEVLAFQTLEFFGLGDVFKKISGRAGGGGVESGRPYIVGERGPELFVPNQSGRVVPNSALGGQSGGMPQFVTNIDARGADPGLIARLPRILEDRDRRLLLMMQRYSETGVLPI